MLRSPQKLRIDAQSALWHLAVDETGCRGIKFPKVDRFGGRRQGSEGGIAKKPLQCFGFGWRPCIISAFISSDRFPYNIGTSAIFEQQTNRRLCFISGKGIFKIFIFIEAIRC